MAFPYQVVGLCVPTNSRAFRNGTAPVPPESWRRFPLYYNAFSESPGLDSASERDHMLPGLEQPPLPGERMRHNGVEVLELRRPVERGADAADIGHEADRIAGPASDHLHRQLQPGDALDGGDHLQQLIAVAIAAVERHRSAAAAQMRQRRAMRTREVADMDVIADAGAVRR